MDIVQTYTRPRDVMARRMDGRPREDRALAILLGACALIYVAQWPRLAREAHFDPSIPIDARMAGALFIWIFILPLVFYALAALLQGCLRLLGARPGGYRVRMAVFWALLASTPVWLFAGLMLGFSGQGAGSNIVGTLAIGSFMLFAILGLVVATRSAQEAVL